MISSLELATLCGVSQGTVDRALHDRPGISPATKRRILAMAEKHGYRPHPAARELLTGKRTVVGAVTPASTGVFFLDLLHAVREVLAADGFRLFATTYGDPGEFAALVDDFAARRARACVVIPPRDHFPLPARTTREMPVVSLLGPCGGKNVHHFAPDEVATGRAAAARLVKAGHRKLLHLTYGRESAAIRDRAEGFVQEAIRRGASAAVVVDADPPALLASVRDTGATALFCHNDWLALSALRALQAAGRHVPLDVSVLGVDHSPTFVGLCPGIDSFRYPCAEIAAAVGAVVRGEEPPPVPACEPVEGDTLAPPALSQR